MKIFTDESGKFNLKSPSNISTVVSLICTDTIYDEICYYLKTFCKKYNIKSEIKGTHLTLDQREQVCRFLYKNRNDITIAVTGVDSDLCSPNDLVEFRLLQANSSRNNKELYISNGGNAPLILQQLDKITKIAEHSSRLSNEEFLQVLITFEHMKDVIQYSIVYYIDWKYAKEDRIYERY